MKLSPDDLFLLSQCAISAAYQAGQVIHGFQNQAVPIQAKTGGASIASQVVTEVDYLAQDIILQTLRPTCDIFDLALLTEETPDDKSRLEKDYFWCIDPLDGTLQFTESNPGYAVSIALVACDGTPIIGVVYDPVEKTLYCAVQGQGAYKNGKLWSLSTSTGRNLTLVSDSGFTQHPLYTATITTLEAEYVLSHFLKHGGAAMNACWALDNTPGCYFKFPRAQKGGGCLWDFAATACLFIEIGAVACDIFGAALDLNRADDTFMNHRGVLFASDPVLAERIVELYALQNKGKK